MPLPAACCDMHVTHACMHAAAACRRLRGSRYPAARTACCVLPPSLPDRFHQQRTKLCTCHCTVALRFYDFFALNVGHAGGLLPSMPCTRSAVTQYSNEAIHATPSFLLFSCAMRGMAQQRSCVAAIRLCCHAAALGASALLPTFNACMAVHQPVSCSQPALQCMHARAWACGLRPSPLASAHACGGAL